LAHKLRQKFEDARKDDALPQRPAGIEAAAQSRHVDRLGRAHGKAATYNDPMKKRVYLETSIVSYLTSRPSRDLVTAANQQISHEWWQRRHTDFELVASRYVWLEAAAGDPVAAGERLAFLEGIAELPFSPEVEALANALCAQGALPLKARLDALHVAAAAVAGVDYLLTWNCTHIANAETLPRIEQVCREQGFEPPRISTPPELLGSDRH
jgi:hypothetical protein